jgi:hypothetical protein
MATNLLNRIVDPLADCLSREVAERIVNLRAEADVQQRIDELADLANRGRLSEEQKAEYDEYLSAFHFVTMLQARARHQLRQQG